MSYRDIVGIAKQSAFATKTTAASAFMFPPVTKESLAIERENITIEETSGTRAPSSLAYGTSSVKGDIEGAIRPTSFPLFLAGAFGVPASTVLSGGAFSHVFDSTAASALLPLSIYTVNTDPVSSITDLYFGCYVDELEFTAAVDEYVMYKAAIVGAGLDTTQSAPAATGDTSARFTALNVSGSLGVSGQAKAGINLKDCTIKYTNGLSTDDKILGSASLASVPLGNAECEVEFTIVDTSAFKTHYHTYFTDATTPVDLELELTITGATISGVHAYKVIINVARFQYTEVPVEIDAGSVMSEMKVKGRACLSSGGDLVTVTVVNNTTNAAGVAYGGAQS